MPEPARNPANRLLLAALREPASMTALASDDWNILLRLARATRLLGRLEASLAARGLLDAVPPHAAEQLRAARNLARHRQTLVRWELDRVCWALEGLDIPLIALKGAAYLVAELPPAPGRVLADLDLLFPRARLPEVERRLLARGWLQRPLSRYDEHYYRHWMHELPPLRHRERPCEVDLHHAILPPTSRLGSRPESLFEEARDLGGVCILAPPDMVLHALAHCFLDGDPREGLRLRDLLDANDLIGHFAPREPAFWPSLARRARALGLEGPLYYGLRLHQQLFDAAIPEAVWNGIETPLAAPLMERLFARALLPGHLERPRADERLARWLVYARAHWLRMPSALLARHLAYKAWLRVRGSEAPPSWFNPLDLQRL
ncbi:MAG: nucleotidyltransferase family protein [Chromatiaceae bacterium]|nr:nucleotidyltransferase family protein [Chromatiaceae bacterium]